MENVVILSKPMHVRDISESSSVQWTKGQSSWSRKRNRRAEPASEESRTTEHGEEGRREIDRKRFGAWRLLAQTTEHKRESKSGVVGLRDAC